MFLVMTDLTMRVNNAAPYVEMNSSILMRIVTLGTLIQSFVQTSVNVYKGMLET